MKKRVRHGGLIPPYYRLAWHDLIRYEGICYPIGIHWIARGCRRVWEWSLKYRESEFERQMLESYQSGRAAGLRQTGEANAIARFIRKHGKSTALKSD